VSEGVKDLRIGCEEGLDSVSEVASGRSSETKDKECGCEEMDDKNATTGVTNN
jgi:hypothetical protein